MTTPIPPFEMMYRTRSMMTAWRFRRLAMKSSKSIMHLKNNKAAGPDGLPTELFKTECNELVERMPNDWNFSGLCPAMKKGDHTICANCRSIILFPIAYKVLTGLLCERLKPLIKTLIGPNQCGFRPGKSTRSSHYVKS